MVVCRLPVAASLVGSTGPRCAGFSTGGTWAQYWRHVGSVLAARGLGAGGTWARYWRHVGSVAPQHAGSSQISGRIHARCTDRQILNQRTPGKSQTHHLKTQP